MNTEQLWGLLQLLSYSLFSFAFLFLFFYKSLNKAIHQEHEAHAFKAKGINHCTWRVSVIISDPGVPPEAIVERRIYIWTH